MLFQSSASMVYGRVQKPFNLFQRVSLTFKKRSARRDKLYHLREHIKATEVLFYIGAYTTEDLYLLTTLAKPSEKLVLFTPAKESYDELTGMVKILQLDNVTIILIADSQTSADGVAAIPFQHETAVIRETVVIQETYSKKEKIAAVRTVDEYCFTHNMHPQLLEIKSPGSELALLKGAEGILKRFRPKLVIECRDRSVGRKGFAEVVNWLTGMRYKNFFILDYTRFLEY